MILSVNDQGAPAIVVGSIYSLFSWATSVSPAPLRHIDIAQPSSCGVMTVAPARAPAGITVYPTPGFFQGQKYVFVGGGTAGTSHTHLYSVSVGEIFVTVTLQAPPTKYPTGSGRGQLTIRCTGNAPIAAPVIAAGSNPGSPSKTGGSLIHATFIRGPLFCI